MEIDAANLAGQVQTIADVSDTLYFKSRPNALQQAAYLSSEAAHHHFRHSNPWEAMKDPLKHIDSVRQRLKSSWGRAGGSIPRMLTVGGRAFPFTSTEAINDTLKDANLFYHTSLAGLARPGFLFGRVESMEQYKDLAIVTMGEDIVNNYDIESVAIRSDAPNPVGILLSKTYERGFWTELYMLERLGKAHIAIQKLFKYINGIDLSRGQESAKGQVTAAVKKLLAGNKAYTIGSYLGRSYMPPALYNALCEASINLNMQGMETFANCHSNALVYVAPLEHTEFDDSSTTFREQFAADYTRLGMLVGGQVLIDNDLDVPGKNMARYTQIFEGDLVPALLSSIETDKNQPLSNAKQHIADRAIRIAGRLRQAAGIDMTRNQIEIRDSMTPEEFGQFMARIAGELHAVKIEETERFERETKPDISDALSRLPEAVERYLATA